MDNQQINKAVATKVMGWVEDGPYWMDSDGQSPHQVHAPGTEEDAGRFGFQPTVFPNDAYEMEEKIKERFREDDYTRALYAIVTSNGYFSTFDEWWALVHASPLARCQAALKVYGVAE